MRQEQVAKGYFKVQLRIGDLVIDMNLGKRPISRQYRLMITDQDVFKTLPREFQAACLNKEILVRMVQNGKEVVGFAVITESVQGLVEVQAWTYIPPKASKKDVENPVWEKNTITQDKDARKRNTNFVVLSYEDEEIEATVGEMGSNYQCCFTKKARGEATSVMKKAIEKCKVNGINDKYKFLLYRTPLKLNEGMLNYGFKLLSTEIMIKK
jgi:hypothetical protein